MSNNQRQIQRQTVTVSANLARDGYQFSKRIALNFQPHDMVVRSVCYYAVENDDIPVRGVDRFGVSDNPGMYTIGTNLVNSSSPLCDFMVDDFDNGLTVRLMSFHSTPGTCFNVSDFVNNSTYQFSISSPFLPMGGQRASDTRATPNLSGNLLLTLEFIRYN